MQITFSTVLVSIILGVCGLLPLPDGQGTVLAQSIPPGLHARIIQLEDERNLNGDELAKLLKHASPKVRERAALAIGRIGDKRGTASLIELLQSEKDESVRAMAAFALGEMEDAQAVPALMALLEAGKHSLSSRARPAEALGKIASIPANIELLGKATIEQISNRLVEQLPDPKATMTAEKSLLVSLTITALMRVRAASSVEPLTQQLKSDDADIRAQAANALSRIRQPIASAVPALLEALNDPDTDARANAARALGISKDVRGVEPLIKLLSDKSEQVQVSSIRALAAIGDRRAVEPLRKMLERLLNNGFSCQDSQLSLAIEIATSLGIFRDKDSIPLLRQLRLIAGIGASPEIEIATAKLGKFFNSPDGIGPSCISLTEGWKKTANTAQALGEIESLAAENWLRELLKQSEATLDMNARAIPAILRALAKHKPEDLPKILRQQLSNKDVIVRATAANLLVDLRSEEIFVALAEASVNEKSEGANDAKLAILSALSKYKSEKAIEAIKAGSNDPDHLVRRHAINLLKQMGAGDFSDGIGIVRTGHNRTFYTNVAARMNRKVTARIYTAKGAVAMELYPQEAPITVDSFITLARRGYFNNLTFHRVVPNFVIQGGDPRGDGEGGPGYQIRCEVNTRAYGRGALGMALSGKDTGGSQFFITHSPQPHLDGGYTVFGQVTKGMDVVDQIVRGDVIKRIEIIER